MTVKELIESLEECGNLDAEVYIGMEMVGTSNITLEIDEGSVGIVEVSNCARKGRS